MRGYQGEGTSVTHVHISTGHVVYQGQLKEEETGANTMKRGNLGTELCSAENTCMFLADVIACIKRNGLPN